MLSLPFSCIIYSFIDYLLQQMGCRHAKLLGRRMQLFFIEYFVCILRRFWLRVFISCTLFVPLWLFVVMSRCLFCTILGLFVDFLCLFVSFYIFIFPPLLWYHIALPLILLLLLGALCGLNIVEVSCQEKHLTFVQSRADGETWTTWQISYFLKSVMS